VNETLKALAANKDLLTLAGSAIVVLFMLGVGVLLGFAKNSALDDASLRQRLADYEPDARILSAAIDAKGRAALAQLADGRILVARAMGDNATLRLVAPNGLKLNTRAGKSGAKVSVRFADMGFPSLNMTLRQVPDWLAALGARP
jgi:hypothetical protein